MVKTLKDFGFGKVSLENVILSETEHIIENIQSSNGRPVSPQLLFNVGVLNIIFCLGDLLLYFLYFFGF